MNFKQIILCLVLSITVYANNKFEGTVVKIHSSVSRPNYSQPWQSNNRIQFSGSGVLIENNYIITNAHVISDAKFIQVSKDNESKKYTASVAFVSYQADLALLKVKDKKFFENTKALKFTEDIKTGDNITVFGYLLGGKNLSITKSVVSRIEKLRYLWSYEYLLGIQIDAAINSGVLHLMIKII